MKSENVAKDIQELLAGVRDGSTSVSFESVDFLGKYGAAVAGTFKRTVMPEEKVREPNVVYASEVGTACGRQLWYKVYRPDLGEKMRASMSMKYMYGGIVEDTVLALAELAGHKVTRKQERVVLTNAASPWRIKGRIDCVLNGDTIVDVKSTTS